MHDTEHRVTVGDGVDQDAHRANVEKLVELEILALHLAPDTDDMLYPALYAGVDFLLAEQMLEALGEALDESLALAALFFQQFGDALVGLGLEGAKRQVFQFPLKQTHAQSIRQRRENIQRFLGN